MTCPGDLGTCHPLYRNHIGGLTRFFVLTILPL
jgi:hypothetical protein